MRISDWSSDVCSSDLDLQPVELEAPQIGQRGISRAEIVERDAEAMLAQVLQRLARIAGRVHHHIFGDFEDDLRGPDMGCCDHADDPPDEAVRLELHGRKLDRYLKTRRAAAVLEDLRDEDRKNNR